MATRYPVIPDVRILRRLSKRGATQIFRGHDSVLDIPVAIKVVEVGADRSARLEVRREAQAMAQLRHPHLVSIYRAGMVENSVYIVMEYISGMTLLDQVGKNGPLPHRQAARIAVSILDALVFLHNRVPPLVHMDVSPVNIMIDRMTGEPRLMDFGSAVSRQRKRPFFEGFAAPERMAGMLPDPKMDVYAMGVVFWFLLTGTVLSSDRSDQDAKMTPYSAVIWRMLSSNAQERPTAGEAAREIREVAAGHTGSKRSKAVYFLAGCLVFFVILLLCATVGCVAFFLLKG